MSSEFGKILKVSIFGQSHGEGIGVVINGLPPGETLDLDAIDAFMRRRAPGRSPLSTPRQEADKPEFIAGLLGNVTCGAPLCALIRNRDTRSGDYEQLRDVPRPGHADYPATIRYKGAQDLRGGGHFSGRLTAPLCIAGAICLQLLAKRGIFIGAHIAAVADIDDVRISVQFAYISLHKEPPLLLCVNDLRHLGFADEHLFLHQPLGFHL